jgi:hypothetical protein
VQRPVTCAPLRATSPNEASFSFVGELQFALSGRAHRLFCDGAAWSCAANSVGEVFDVGRKDFPQRHIVSPVKRCREIQVDSDTVELHSRITLLALKRK